jgi:hypothetical protein
MMDATSPTEQFERLWRKAHREGERAMHAAKESPSWCFVNVRISDGLFAHWLVKMGKARYSADFNGNQGAVRVFVSVIFKDVHDCGRQEARAAFLETGFGASWRQL